MLRRIVLPTGDFQRAPLIHDTRRANIDFLGLYRHDSKNAESMCVEVLGNEVGVDTLNKQARLSSKKVAKANGLIINALALTT
ncbi:hypothetical protein E4U19_000539 [Claviceps sp. Clav32 group G5]|nr:hypothetical protein E4U19_000539 [Claviceps sp. Clav32 group G5]